MPRLKVFRTAIGFHDAYVAAPSMKAALAAWGSGSNLFEQGLAELVNDPKLTKAALATPGKVIKVVRGSEAEHFAALGPAPARAKAPKDAKPAKPKPRPSRARLDAAEAALAAAQAEHARAIADLAAQEASLRDRRRKLEAKQDAAAAKLQSRVDDETAAYEAAMARWRD